ncbi:MAG: hypothetical protein QM692_13655 [Thermomicrobiales bacterium]
MDAAQFDAVSRSVNVRLTRRRVGLMAGATALGAAALAAWGGAPEAAAKKRRAKAEHNLRGNKAIMCVNGVTTRVPKKKRKKYLKQGATRGECANTCTPSCPTGACNVSDGCGGTCGCASGSVCASGTCRACNVLCQSGDTPAVCGEALQTAMAAGGDVYVCPGRYLGGFVLGAQVSVYGAGNGDNPAVDAILDGQNVLGTTVVTMAGEGTFELFNLRITGGANSGVRLSNSAVTGNITDCVITGNTAEAGAGIALSSGALHLVGSTISTNTASGGGAGMLATSSGSSTITTTIFTGNISAADGGGILQYNGTLTLDSTVSITGNQAGAVASGGGVLVGGGTFNRGGATISGNTPDNCVGTGC